MISKAILKKLRHFGEFSTKASKKKARQNSLCHDPLPKRL